MVTKDGAVKILDFGLAKLLKQQTGRDVQRPDRPGHAGRHGPGDGRLHVARAGERQAARLPLRPVLAGLDLLRDGDRQARVPARHDRRDADGDHPRGHRAGRAAQRRTCRRPSAGSSNAASRRIPEERYASTRDLARDVRGVREHLSEAASSVSGEVSGAVARDRPRAEAVARGPGHRGDRASSRPSAPGCCCRSSSVRTLPPSYQQITFGSGTIRAARFAPDGQTIVYSAAWDGTPLKLFLKHPSSPDSLPLELPSANLLSISPSGEMAIAVDCRSNHPGVCAGTLARAALTGGSPRDVAEGIQEADWAPDGTTLMVVRDIGGKSRIEFPIGQGAVRDLGPRQLREALAQGRSDRLSRPSVPARRRGDRCRDRPCRQEDDPDRQVGERGRPRVVAVGRRGLVHGHRGRRQPLALGRDAVGKAARRHPRTGGTEAP